MDSQRRQRLLSSAVASGIDTPKALANFMAQVEHESGGFQRLEEGFRYTRGIEQITSKVKSALREGPEVLEAARQEALRNQPGKLAELMYGGRMGNDQPGDGYRYRGRGYIQLTGKDIYAEAGRDLELDLLNDPGLAAKPEHAEKIAIWYWQKKVPARAQGNVKAATKAINGGYNGLADRERRFEKWLNELTPERINRIKEERQVPAGDSTSASKDAPAAQAQRADVKKLQSMLATLGYHGKNGRVLLADGLLGPQTQFAIREFQKEHGLKSDGVVGPKTEQSLDRAIRRHRKALAQRQPAGWPEQPGSKTLLPPQALDLYDRIAGVLPQLNGGQHAQVTAYCMQQCRQQDMALEQVASVTLLSFNNKNLLVMHNQDQSQMVTADVDKALRIPVEQSLAAIE